MQEKYIELLLKRCLKVNQKTPLFISYNKIIYEFVKKVQKYAESLGVKDIYLDETDSNLVHYTLENYSLEEIERCALFNASVWDEYAKKDAAFLMLDSNIPHIMDDIDASKVACAAMVRSKTKPVYKERQLKGEIAWCIACVPNPLWAKDLFKDVKDPVNKFWHTLGKICYLDEEDPILFWNQELMKRKKVQDKLNALEITKLYYKNNLGTDFEVELGPEHLWSSASSGKWIVNMPSYEVFTTPNYKSTNGVIYASKPLLYAGKEITDFYLKFANGKVVDFDAKMGKDILKEIIASDEYSAFLGEVALVNYDSPISNTNLVFKSTLIDENASCHVALGSGFNECIKNGEEKSSKELLKLGVNPSNNHVDFMIGTKDLLIEADTNKGRITIMKDGNIVL